MLPVACAANDTWNPSRKSAAVMVSPRLKMIRIV